MKKFVIGSFTLIISLSIILCFYLPIQKHKASKEELNKVFPVKNNFTRAEPVLSKNYTEKLTIGAIGDILIHDWVYEDAYLGGSYNFDPMFQNVKEVLEKPDILTANQESVLGGTEIGVSSYPMFNSPHEVADALVHNGVDIVSTANNHSLDKGEQGIDSEADYLDQIQLPHVGSFKNKMDQDKLRIIEKNGIKLAFLSYTYGTNGIPIPLGKDFLVNIIDRVRMAEEIHRAKDSADVVIMSLHWGNEYQRMPTKEQKDLANFLANEGADIIFGSHPHVLQPMEWIHTTDGRKSFIVYSLGNFISGQIRDYKDIGGMATIEIIKHFSAMGQTVELSNPQFYPTYVSSKRFKNYRVVPLETAEPFGLPNASEKYKEIQNHMYQWIQ